MSMIEHYVWTYSRLISCTLIRSTHLMNFTKFNLNILCVRIRNTYALKLFYSGKMYVTNMKSYCKKKHEVEINYSRTPLV